MRNKKAIEDIILEAEADRRLMPNVPDPSNRRSNHDRRNNYDADASRPQYATYAGQRYALNIVVRIPAAVRSSELQLVPRLPISSMKHGLPPRSR